MIAAEKRIVSPEEYLAIERQALDKSEFFKGEIIPIAGATQNHNRINENLSVLIGIFLEEAPCQSFSSDMRVHLPATGLYAYPDLVIVCGQPELLLDGFDNLLNPVVLIEVVSEGTEDYDRAGNFCATVVFPHFRNISSSIRSKWRWKYGVKTILASGHSSSNRPIQPVNLLFRLSV